MQPSKTLELLTASVFWKLKAIQVQAVYLAEHGQTVQEMMKKQRLVASWNSIVNDESSQPRRLDRGHNQHLCHKSRAVGLITDGGHEYNIKAIQRGGDVVEEQEQGPGDVMRDVPLLVLRGVGLVDLQPIPADKGDGVAPACSGKGQFEKSPARGYATGKQLMSYRPYLSYRKRKLAGQMENCPGNLVGHGGN